MRCDGTTSAGDSDVSSLLRPIRGFRLRRALARRRPRDSTPGASASRRSRRARTVPPRPGRPASSRSSTAPMTISPTSNSRATTGSTPPAPGLPASCPPRAGRHLRRTRRARRSSGRGARGRNVLRPKPLFAIRSLPPRRGSGRARLLRRARSRLQTPPPGPRGCRSLRSSATSLPRSRLGGAAAGSPSCPGSATPPASGTCAAVVNWRSISTSRARLLRVAPSACCVSSGCAASSAPTAARHSTVRRGTSFTPRSVLRPPRSSAKRGYFRPGSPRSRARPSAWSAARAAEALTSVGRSWEGGVSRVLERRISSFALGSR